MQSELWRKSLAGVASVITGDACTLFEKHNL